MKLLEDNIYLFVEYQISNQGQTQHGVQPELRVYKYNLVGGDPVSFVTLTGARLTGNHRATVFKNGSSVWYCVSTSIQLNIYNSSGDLFTFRYASGDRQLTSTFISITSSQDGTGGDNRFFFGYGAGALPIYFPTIYGIHVYKISRGFRFNLLLYGKRTFTARFNNRLLATEIDWVSNQFATSRSTWTDRARVDLSTLAGVVEPHDYDRVAANAGGFYVLGPDLVNTAIVSGRTVTPLTAQRAIVSSQQTNIGGLGGFFPGTAGANYLTAQQVDVDGSNQDRIVLFGPTRDNTLLRAIGRIHYIGVEGTQPPPPPNNVPRITTSVTTYNLPIHTPLGSRVAVFAATDADENDQVIFSLTGADASMFAIGETTGILTTTSLLENGATFNIVVNASDRKDTATLAVMATCLLYTSPSPRDS